MADEYETLREVGHGIGSVRNEIRIYAGVVVLIAGAFGWAFTIGFDKLDRLEESLAETKGILSTVAVDTAETRSDMSDVKTALAGTPSSDEEELIADMQDIFGGPFETANGVAAFMANYGTLEAIAQNADQTMLEDIKLRCLAAEKDPSSYSVGLLGTCAAITNALP